MTDPIYRRPPISKQTIRVVGLHTIVQPPLPHFFPALPRLGSLAGFALWRLLAGEVICDRLVANADDVVTELRMLGWPIDTFEALAPTEGSPYRVELRYELPAEYATEARARIEGLLR